MTRVFCLLSLLLCLSVITWAEPITFSISPANVGFTFVDGSPCSRTLNCQNTTPRGGMTIKDAAGNLLSTVSFSSLATQFTLDIGQSATVNLGLITFTGALPPTGLEVNFLLGILGVTSTNGFTAALSFSAAGSGATTAPQSPQGVNSLVTLSNGVQLRVTGVTTTNGQAAVSITRLGGAAEVPEPMTLLLVGSGLAGLAVKRKRQKLKNE